MSNRFDLTRGRLAGLALALILAFAAVPVAAQASAVNLGTASPFVVLGASAVTNERTSVLNGDLGVWSGTSLTGFENAVVNGVTHESDEVAHQAQSDVTVAYNEAAKQPISEANDLTDEDLGNKKLTAGAYGFSSSAQLTGQLTLDAQGDPNAQFVFVIGSTLTTASASSIILVNGASPCNVYWKVGSSATLGSTTSFVGNLMALESISVTEKATVLGRLLARNGAVTLIEDTLSVPDCSTTNPPEEETTPPPDETATPPTGSTPTPTGATETATTPTGTTPTPGRGSGSTTAEGKGKPGSKPAVGNGSATIARGKTTTAGIPATVHGRKIKHVVFTDNGKRIPNTSKTQTNVSNTPGTHAVVAHVTFKDSTKPKTVKINLRVPFPVLHPHRGPSQFTG